MGGLAHRTGPGYLELPYSNAGLLKGLVLATAGLATFLISDCLEKEVGLVAAGFYVLPGAMVFLFVGAAYYLVFSRVVRLESGSGRVVVRRGFRVMHLIPVWWSYECDQLSVHYVKGRTRDEKHLPMADVWRIRGTQDRGSLLGGLFSDLAIFSNRQDAVEFMRLAGQFVQSTGMKLPSSSERVLRLTPPP